MRKSIILLMLFFLVGCSDVDYAYEERFQSVKENLESSDIVNSNNFNKGLFSYYLPQNIGVLDSDKISSILISDGIKIYMSVNVSSIMSEKEKELNLSESDFKLMKDFQLQGRKDVKNGKVYIEDLGNNNYLLYMLIDDVFFLSSIKQAELEVTMQNMLQVARSLDLKKDDIVAEFSNKETISYQKEVIELFSDAIPEDGMIKDIIIEEAGD